MSAVRKRQLRRKRPMALRKRTAAVIGTATALGLGITAIMSPATADDRIVGDSTAESTTDAQQEGRDLFSAMYFGVGDAAEGLDTDLDDASYSAFRESVENFGPDLGAIEEILDTLERDDSDVFNDFHTEMTSGDVLRVEAEFIDTAESLNAVADELQYESTTSRAAASPSDANPMAVVPVFVVWVAVAEAAGAVHALTLAVQMNLAWTENVAWSAAAGTSDLDTEKGVVALTDTLAAY
jgi:SdpC family antimicrobial peptide